MSEESATPDLAALAQHLTDAANALDFEAVASFYAPDAVFEHVGIGRFEGRAAIRGFFEEWIGTFAEWRQESEEIRDLGNGAASGVYLMRGRLPGGTSLVEERYAAIATLTDGLIDRRTHYTDIDEARAAAERLAMERG